VDERRGGAVRLQPAPDMRSEGLWRRGGAEWRVAVLTASRRSGACSRAPALRRIPVLAAPPRISVALVGRQNVPSLPPFLPLRSPFSTGNGLATPVVTLRHRCSANTCRLQNANCELGCEMRPRAIPYLGKTNNGLRDFLFDCQLYEIPLSQRFIVIFNPSR